MQKKVIKRFGINELGADPNWIIETQLINKSDSIPEGFEGITNSAWKIQLDSQLEEYNNWFKLQPIPVRNFNFLQERLANTVKNNSENAYRLYKFIAPDLVKSIEDITLPPKGIDYIINVIPKLKAVRTFNKGFLTMVKWYAWDYENNIQIEEVLKVTIEYTQIDDAPMDSAKSVTSRTTTRQWIKENGTYDETLSDVKITPKTYETQLERNNEGVTRRSNIFVDLSEKYVTLLAILVTSGDVQAAQEIGKGFLSEITSDLSDFKSIGSNKILTTLDNLTDSQYILDTPINDTALPLEAIGAIRALVPLSEGYTIREFIKEKFKGNI